MSTECSLFYGTTRSLELIEKKLSLPRDKGGLGIPNVYLYYLAFNARYSLIWGYKKSRDKGSWDWLEEHLVKEKNKFVSLSSLWYTPAPPKKLITVFLSSHVT